MSVGSVGLPSIAQGRADLCNPPATQGASPKAARYIDALYDARCAGQWDSIAELARKVEKHAPERRCLALAAKAGSRMFSNPSLEHFKLTEDEFGEHLSQAARRAESPAIDVLDATVCRAAMLLGAGRAQSALSHISEPLHRMTAPSKGDGIQGLVCICVLQGTLVRGVSLERLQNTAEASNTYRSIIAFLSSVIKLPSQCPELHRWTEELLCRICLFFATDNVAQTAHLGEAMASFHLLSQYLDRRTWRPLAARATFSHQTPRQVWKAYFETLSRLVREDLVYHPSPIYRDHDTLEHRGLLDEEDYVASRIRQRADLRRVESNYETILLKESKFPRANEVNQDIKNWVELVMGNWNKLCGPNWTVQELGGGSGAKAVVSRSALDMLYSATTKTFHSTQILRHLFTVHAYLGEFDIAFKAFDSYVDIMTKGKARAEKSGKVGSDLDDDDIAVRLAAEAIRVACRLGSEVAAEKALNISETLQTWVEKRPPELQDNGVGENVETTEKASEDRSNSKLSPDILSLAYRAIGISQAQYARSTPLPASRAEMQKKAVENLRRSLSQGLDAAACVESHFALGLLFAETRDTTGAIQTIKQALDHPDNASDRGKFDKVQSNSTPKEGLLSTDIDLVKHVKLLPAWHLLAQLLCAREEFEMASTCCTLALERLGGLSHLLQKSSASNAPQRTSVRDFSQKSAPTSNDGSQNPVDNMDNMEKQVLLEIKMTQLALSEVIDGPEAAVNGTNELLALFARLFGMIDFDSSRKSKAGAIMSPPKSSSGTIRSIFGRPKSVRRTAPGTPATTTGLPSKTNSALTTRPTTSTASQPTIQVTNPTGGVTPPSQSLDPEKRQKHNVLRKKSSSIRRQDITHELGSSDNVDEKHMSDDVEPTQSNHARVSFQNGKTGEDESKETNGVQPLGEITENLPSHSKPPPSGDTLGQPSTQDANLPALQPQERNNAGPPVLEELREQRFKSSLLVKIWLFVARLYSKVSLFDDANEAVKEARKLLSGLEAEVLRQNSSIRQLQDQGWGRAKSIDQLWADIFAEEGKLYQARSLPHDALESFENALLYDPDHPEATVALSGILLDIYCRIIPPEKRDQNDLLIAQMVPMASTTTLSTPAEEKPQPKPTRSSNSNPEPLELSRLASRDRAYGLLSSLTKLGSGWDDAEAWFVLARAYEESGQIDKAKEALWWTVHLEDTKPIRHWRNVNPGGYVL